MQLALGLDLFIDDDFGNWLAGFVDGEGSFQVRSIVRKDRHVRKDGTCQDSHECDVFFQIRLRIDDIDILLKIKEVLQCGDVSISYAEDTRRFFKNAYPSAEFIVRSCSDLWFIIVPLFEKYPLRAKKRRDFEIWKQAVELAYLAKQTRNSHKLRKRALSDNQWREFERLSMALKEVRKPKDLTVYLSKIPKSKWGTAMRREYGNS